MRFRAVLFRVVRATWPACRNVNRSSASLPSVSHLWPSFRYTDYDRDSHYDRDRDSRHDRDRGRTSRPKTRRRGK